MQPQRVALIAAACLTTGWLLASVVSPPVAELQELPDRPQPRAERAKPATVDAPFTEQLHQRLQQLPVAPVPRRNPFVFGSRTRMPVEVAASSARAPEPEISIVRGPTTFTAPGPSFKLSGVGSTDAAEGPIRTAILSDGTTVHLAKVGETVGGYSVVEIAEDAVTLADAAGARWVLKFR